MRELSLFSGAGGGLLATKHLMGWMAIGYVEIDPYCQRVLRARIDDGMLDDAPVWTDVREFIQSGAAAEYRGFADVVTAGFPCQPFSTAPHGRRVAEDLWPIAFQAISIVQPAYVFLENVSRDAIREAEDDLAHTYSGQIGCISAASLGAPHHRPRWWLAAHADGNSKSRRTEYDKMARVPRLPVVGWWSDEPRPMGMDDGLAPRMDRLRAIGNGQVPAVAAAAWRLLTIDN